MNSNFQIVGLNNIGNICFVNTAFQCLVSLKSMASFLQDEYCNLLPDLQFMQMIQNNMYRMQYYEPKPDEPCELTDELLQYCYKELLYGASFNSQQDITELLDPLFARFKEFAPRTYANFQVMATTECPGSRKVDASWTLMLYVPEDDMSIDIGEMLSEAVFLEPGQVCKCGQNRIHFYGELPQCLVITVIKQTFDKVLKRGFVRRSVQVKCESAYTINGVEFEIKAAAEYIGKDGKGGSSELSKPTFNKLPKEWLKYFEELDEKMVPIQEELEIQAKPVEEKSSFNQVPKEKWLISFDEQLPTPVQEIAQESSFIEPSRSSSKIVRNEDVHFKSKPRNKPLADPRAGHYKSYVKRDEGYYHISDLNVRKTRVIETDDLYVLFYERK